MGIMRGVTILSIGIIIGMSVVHFIRMKDKPKPLPFRPVTVEQFEREQPAVLQKYGKLIVD
jgi:hypothetical protein